MSESLLRAGWPRSAAPPRSRRRRGVVELHPRVDAAADQRLGAGEQGARLAHRRGGGVAVGLEDGELDRALAAARVLGLGLGGAQLGGRFLALGRALAGSTTNRGARRDALAAPDAELGDGAGDRAGYR